MSEASAMPLTHVEAWNTLPWYVNGTADLEVCAALENHLRSCARCREELETQRAIFATVASDSNIECVPSVSLQRLWSRIDQAARIDDPAHINSPAHIDSPARTDRPDRNAPGAEPDHNASAAMRRLSRWALPFSLGPRRRTPRPAAQTASLPAWAVAALSVESIAVAALALTLGMGLHHGGTGGGDRAGDYRTVSSPAQVAAAAEIRAVFAPTMTLQALQVLLQDAKMHIVSGPTEAGVYSLAPLDARGRDSARALQRLRADPKVRFAESIAPP